jgi:hypothetical protein
VIARGGHQAALNRQAHPAIHKKSSRTVQGNAGRWDPGVTLECQWTVNGKASGKLFGAIQGQKVSYVGERRDGKVRVQLVVTGKKMGYVSETRKSSFVVIG